MIAGVRLGYGISLELSISAGGISITKAGVCTLLLLLC